MIARAADPADCAGVIACALHYTSYPPTPEHVSDLFEMARATGSMFVAEHDGAIIGFLCALVLPHAFTGRPYADVIAWWVPEPHRHLGAGYALLRQFLRWESTRTLDMVRITAPMSSHIGTILQRAGYTPVEVGYLKGAVFACL